MTTYEHAMLGATVALALGCQRRHGWGPVLAAGIAGAVPDWDGLSIVLGGAAYARVHRAWGHNLLTAAIVGLVVGGLAYLWRSSLRPRGQAGPLIGEFSLAPPPSFSGIALMDWLLAGLLGALSHLPADLIYSSHPDMTPWPIVLLWPFSARGWVYPLVPWGDVVASVLFVAEMFAIYYWRSHTRVIAWMALLLFHGYVGLRWLMADVLAGLSTL